MQVTGKEQSFGYNRPTPSSIMSITRQSTYRLSTGRNASKTSGLTAEETVFERASISMLLPLLDNISLTASWSRVQFSGTVPGWVPRGNFLNPYATNITRRATSLASAVHMDYSPKTSERCLFRAQSTTRKSSSNGGDESH